jgi:hypothetical protein
MLSKLAIIGLLIIGCLYVMGTFPAVGVIVLVLGFVTLQKVFVE